MITKFNHVNMAWNYLMDQIKLHGDNVISEDGKGTRELRNVLVEIQNPGEGWPVGHSGWDIPALDTYAKNEILSPDNPTGFNYTYGERLFAYDGIYEDYDYLDQIAYCVKKLEESNTTRRAIAITWNPSIDTFTDEVPCLQMVEFLIRDGKLHLTATFRSWDCGRAAIANLYGLNKLLMYVANEIGIATGSLSVFAISAHIYWE